MFAPSAQPLGTACDGANGSPVATCNTPALLDAVFALDVLSARANSPCEFGISTTTQSLPIGGGCTLYLSSPIALSGTATNAFGFASVSLPVPLDPQLYGATFHSQAIVLDPLGAAGGLAFTNARTIVIGD